MLRCFQFCLCGLTTLLLMGCQDSGTPTNVVAIVNIDTVLKMTGVDLEISNAIQERQEQLRNSLEAFQQKLDDQWMAKKKEFGDEPTEEQKRELQILLNQLNTQNQQARNQANQDISGFQQEMYERFQEQVSPVSLEVAKSHGYSIVLGQNPSILAFDTSIDITNEVVERMKQLKQNLPEGNAPSTSRNAPITPPVMPNSQTPITPPTSISPPLTPQVKPEVAPTTTPEVKPEAKPEAKSETTQSEPAEKPATPADPPAESKPAEEKPASSPTPAETPEPTPSATPSETGENGTNASE